MGTVNKAVFERAFAITVRADPVDRIPHIPHIPRRHTWRGTASAREAAHTPQHSAAHRHSHTPQRTQARSRRSWPLRQRHRGPGARAVKVQRAPWGGGSTPCGVYAASGRQLITSHPGAPRTSAVGQPHTAPYAQSANVKKMESRDATASATKPALWWPRLRRCHTSYTMQRLGLPRPGTEAQSTRRDSTSSALFMSSSAILLWRASRPESGLNHDIQRDHSHVTLGTQSHAGNVASSLAWAKSEPLKPAQS